jgi:hypothetical protein
MGLKACDHCILRFVVSRKGGDHPSSLHTRRWRPKDPKKLSCMKRSTWTSTWQTIIMFYDLLEFASSPLLADHKLCFMVCWNLHQSHLREVNLTQILVKRFNNATFGWESRALTTTWSRPLARVWSGPYHALSCLWLVQNPYILHRSITLLRATSHTELRARD